MTRPLAVALISIVGLGLSALPLERKTDAISVGGLTELPAWDEAGENLVRNSSFEDRDGDGKPAEWEISSPQFELSERAAHSGRRSLLLAESHRGRYHPAALQRLELARGWYRMSAWMKAEEAGRNQRGAGGRVSLRAGGARIHTPIVAGTTDWTRRQRRVFPVSGGSAQLRLAAYRKPDGKIYFDDVELRRLVPPVVRGFLKYPNYRGLLFADAPQTIRVSVELHPETAGIELSDLRVELSLVPEGGAEPAARGAITPSEPRFSMELDAGALPVGAYALRLAAQTTRAPEASFSHPDHRIVKLPASAREDREVYVDADNVLVLGGERAFVLGIYDTSGYTTSVRKYDERISTIAEAPIDIYLNYWLGRAPRPALEALLASLRRHGMYYLHTVNTWYEDHEQWPGFPDCREGSASALGQERYTACQARELGSLPGLAGWYTADERPADQVERIFEQYRVLRESDPDGITFIAQNRLGELERWRDAADVFDLHSYPIFNIPEGELSPLEQVYRYTRSAIDAVEDSRPVWGVIQYFPFGARGHWPTYEELRAMSYMAVVAGAKGLFYWSYGAKGLAWEKDPERREELWRRLVHLTREIDSLEPVLLQPDAPGVLEREPAGDAVKVLAKRYGDERYVLAVNLTPETVRARLALAEPAGAVRLVGESHPVDLVEGRSIADSLPPYGTRVYRIEPVARPASR